MLTVTALTVAVALNVGFLRFCPKSCLSGHDNKAVVCKVRALVKSRRSFSFRFWAGSRLSASVHGSIISCRLGRSERLAVAANIAAV